MKIEFEKIRIALSVRFWGIKSPRPPFKGRDGLSCAFGNRVAKADDPVVRGRPMPPLSPKPHVELLGAPRLGDMNLMQKNEQSKFWHDQVDQLKKGNLVKLVKLVKAFFFL